MTSVVLRDLWRVRRTSVKMLLKRGYVMPESLISIETQSYEEFKNELVHTHMIPDPETDVAEAKEKLMYISSHESDDEKRIIVFFVRESKLATKQIQNFVDTLDSRKANRAIVICDQGITPHGRTTLAEFAPKYVFEEFTVPELLIDITEHELVPEHIVLTTEEKMKLLSRYNLKDQQLPRLLSSDPIAKYFGLSRGQVVKIIRASETAGRYVTFRIVV